MTLKQLHEIINNNNNKLHKEWGYDNFTEINIELDQSFKELARFNLHIRCSEIDDMAFKDYVISEITNINRYQITLKLRNEKQFVDEKVKLKEFLTVLKNVGNIDYSNNYIHLAVDGKFEKSVHFGLFVEWSEYNIQSIAWNEHYTEKLRINVLKEMDNMEE